jgi:hypothetical protein
MLWNVVGANEHYTNRIVTDSHSRIYFIPGTLEKILESVTILLGVVLVRSNHVSQHSCGRLCLDSSEPVNFCGIFNCEIVDFAVL